MKNYKLLMIVFVAVLASSCGNDDDAQDFAANY